MLATIPVSGETVCSLHVAPRSVVLRMLPHVSADVFVGWSDEAGGKTSSGRWTGNADRIDVGGNVMTDPHIAGVGGGKDGELLSRSEGRLI